MKILILIVFCIICFTFTTPLLIHGQLPPPLPSFQQPSNSSSEKTDDSKPPVIIFLSNTLNLGNNVFKVRIIDESNIDDCKISYSREGNTSIIDCVLDQKDIFKALLKADNSTKRVEVYAEDGNGNTAREIKDVIVKETPNLIQQLFSIFKVPFG